MRGGVADSPDFPWSESAAGRDSEEVVRGVRLEAEVMGRRGGEGGDAAALR